MSIDYRKKHIQAPTSYQQLTNNRPTKKRTFNYALSEQNSNDCIKPHHSNRSKARAQEFSFEVSQSPHKTEETIIRRYPFSREEESRQEKVYDSSPTKELNKKYEIDQRLNNITSINNKITGLLNAVRNKKQDSSSIYTSPRNEQETIRIQATQHERPLNLQDDFITDESAYRQKVRYALRKKYGLNEQAIPSSQDQLSKQSNFKYSTLIQSKVGEQQKETQINVKRVEKENPSSLGPLRTKPIHTPVSPLSDAELNIRANNEKRQKILIDNLILDRQIQEKKQKIFAGSPFNPKTNPAFQAIESSKNKQSQPIPQIPKLTEKPEVLKLAENLSKLVQVDIAMFKFRQSFQSLKDAKKWTQLMSELHSRNIYMEEKDVKQYVTISIHQKNPFGNNTKSYSLNQSKDLAKLMAEAEHLWNEEIEKCVSLDSLAEDDFSMTVIDFSSKGTISLEDLVCFINVNSQKFYRSREVAALFRRFLKRQGKYLDKGVSIGISYGTFMDKVAR